MEDRLKYSVRDNILCGLFLIACVLASEDLCDSSNVCASGYCNPGEYLDAYDKVCSPCRNHTFMNRAGHGCYCCRPCSAPDASARQVIAEPCSPISDAVIGCEPGYRLDAPAGVCLPCPECGWSPLEKARQPDIQVLARETQSMRTSAVIVGSVAGSLILCFMLLGIVVYFKVKDKSYQYSSPTIL